MDGIKNSIITHFDNSVLWIANYVLNVHPEIFFISIAVIFFYVIGFIRQMKMSYYWGLPFRFGFFYTFWMGVCGFVLAMFGAKNNSGYPLPPRQ